MYPTTICTIVALADAGPSLIPSEHSKAREDDDDDGVGANVVGLGDPVVAGLNVESLRGVEGPGVVDGSFLIAEGTADGSCAEGEEGWLGEGFVVATGEGGASGAGVGPLVKEGGDLTRSLGSAMDMDKEKLINCTVSSKTSSNLGRIESVSSHESKATHYSAPNLLLQEPQGVKL